jgi:hypothetical protein
LTGYLRIGKEDFNIKFSQKGWKSNFTNSSNKPLYKKGDLIQKGGYCSLIYVFGFENKLKRFENKFPQPAIGVFQYNPLHFL